MIAGHHRHAYACPATSVDRPRPPTGADPRSPSARRARHRVRRVRVTRAARRASSPRPILEGPERQLLDRRDHSARSRRRRASTASGAPFRKVAPWSRRTSRRADRTETGSASGGLRPLHAAAAGEDVDRSFHRIADRDPPPSGSRHDRTNTARRRDVSVTQPSSVLARSDRRLVPVSLDLDQPSGVHTSTTAISLRVSVPVLSVQMKVVEPSVSTASSRRTSACSRHPLAPIASDSVTVGSRPSGTSATVTPTRRGIRRSGGSRRALRERRSGADTYGDHRDHADDAVELDRERRWRPSGRGCQRRDPGKSGRRPRRRDFTDRLPLRRGTFPRTLHPLRRRP